MPWRTGKNFESETLLRSTSPIPTRIPMTLPIVNTKMAKKWFLNFDPWVVVKTTPKQNATTSLWEMTAVKRIITSGVVSWIPIASPSSSEWIDKAKSIPMMPARVCWQGSTWFVWQILEFMLSSSRSCRFWCSSHEVFACLSASLGVFGWWLCVPYDVWAWLCEIIGCDSSWDPWWCWIASPQQKCKSSSER